jgi:hypothetical protein
VILCYFGVLSRCLAQSQVVLLGWEPAVGYTAVGIALQLTQGRVAGIAGSSLKHRARENVTTRFRQRLRARESSSGTREE